MSIEKSLVVGFFRGLTGLICRIDSSQLQEVPIHGPLIIYTNHVNLVEIPILYTRLQPRPFHGMVLASRWKNPILRWLLRIAEAIPLHRGEPDVVAMRKGLETLARGETLIIAPEGTRSHDGQLGIALPGVVLLALHSGAPLLPLAFFGAERYLEDLSRFKRADFHIRVGKPFRLDARGEKVTRQVREVMLQEMMYLLAGLLPPQYRGRYADFTSAASRYLEFG